MLLLVLLSTEYTIPFSQTNIPGMKFSAILKSGLALAADVRAMVSVEGEETVVFAS